MFFIWHTNLDARPFTALSHILKGKVTQGKYSKCKNLPVTYYIKYDGSNSSSTANTTEQEVITNIWSSVI